MALRGVKVIELAGLAPGPMCGMILADFGASVIRIDRVGPNTSLDSLGNGKKSLALNLKNPKAAAILQKLTNQSDVLIEPFRKGVMESLNLGPQVLMASNPKLIYARLTGFGQSGSFSSMAGHDINYVAMSGLLSMLGRTNEKPTFPLNLIADFGGGGMSCALGILLALFERTQSGKGQVVDAAMVEGSAYLGSWVFRSQNLPIWGNPRGRNILDTGAHFYETYETKDNKFLAVGALEAQFYEILTEKLGLKDVSHFGNFEDSKKIFEEAFKTKTRDEWCAIFNGSDACVTPILSIEEAAAHPHNVEREVFVQSSETIAPNPAPKLSRTPGVSTAVSPAPNIGEHTQEILLSLNYSLDEIAALNKEKVVLVTKEQSKL